MQFRRLVAASKKHYLAKETRKLEKAHIASLIIDAIRKMDPPGRFLKEELGSGLWFDIGDANAIRKAGQALRENSSDIRQDLEASEKDETSPKKKASLKALKIPPTTSGAGLPKDTITSRDVPMRGRQEPSMSSLSKGCQPRDSSFSKQQSSPLPDCSSSMGSFPVTVSIVATANLVKPDLSLVSPEQSSVQNKVEKAEA